MNTDQPKPLKPCPFCGSEAAAHYNYARCSKRCFGNEWYPVEMWNRREPENRELREALREARDQIEYLHREFQPTRTGSIVLGHIDKALAQQPEEKPGQ